MMFKRRILIGKVATVFALVLAFAGGLAGRYMVDYCTGRENILLSVLWGFMTVGYATILVAWVWNLAWPWPDDMKFDDPDKNVGKNKGSWG